MGKLIKAHWESWAACNLHCNFCYRMKEEPLKTLDAKAMMSAIYDAGFLEFVFAGGDPSLRPDIDELLNHAKSIGIRVEVQTNAHLFQRAFGNQLDNVDLFGFSLDSANPEIHDSVRGTKDNFRRVLEAIEFCESNEKPYVVRSVATSRTLSSLKGISKILDRKQFLKKWSIVQFSPVGDGFNSKDQNNINSSHLIDLEKDIADNFNGQLDVYINSQKGGVYFLIKPNGDVYTTETDFEGKVYPAVGNLLQHGVHHCLEKLNINSQAHNLRYQKLIPH